MIDGALIHFETGLRRVDAFRNFQKRHETFENTQHPSNAVTGALDHSLNRCGCGFIERPR
jgi:hypothetical protein